MSALKLTASASSIYARTVTATAKPKAKPKPILCTRTIHHHHNHHYQPGHTITHPAHMPPPSLGLGFTRKTLSFSPNKSGFLGCRSASPSRPGLVTHDTDTDTDTDTSRNEPVPVQSPQSQSEPSKLLTLPTILTLARVAAVPLLVATFYMDGWGGTAATTTIFIAAAVTDWLDGYIARKMNLKSSFGAFLDPVADKLMVAATLVLLCSRPLDVAVFGQVPPWLLTVPSIAIIGREITMSAVREWAASQDSKLLEAVAVNNLGKWKTATQMTALTILLATRGWSDGGAAIVVGSGVVLLYTSAGLAVWSLVVYMKKIWKVLLR